MFQLTRHSTGTSTYRSDVHQVANGIVVQTVPATDGLTKFGGTTTSRPLISGCVPSVVVTAASTANVNDDEYRPRPNRLNFIKLLGFFYR